MTGARGTPEPPGAGPAESGPLAHLAGTADGAAWLERLPRLLRRAEDRWHLELGPRFTAGSASWTTLARRRGDSGWPLVLKVSFPHPEAAAEADALLHWHGHGAPRLVDIEAEDWALLMHAVRPGTPLATSWWPEREALAAGTDVLGALHAVPLPAEHPFEDLHQTLAHWSALVIQRARTQAWAEVDLALVDAWHTTLAALTSTPGPAVLLHGDANPGNILAGEDRWYAIDPKPLVGDAAFDPWPLLEQVAPDPFAAPEVAATLAARCAVVGSSLNLAANRVAAWSFVRSLESVLWLAATTPTHRRADTLPELRRGWRHARAWREAMRIT